MYLYVYCVCIININLADFQNVPQNFLMEQLSKSRLFQYSENMCNIMCQENYINVSHKKALFLKFYFLQH